MYTYIHVAGVVGLLICWNLGTNLQLLYMVQLLISHESFHSTNERYYYGLVCVQLYVQPATEIWYIIKHTVQKTHLIYMTREHVVLMRGGPYHIKLVEGLPLFHCTSEMFGCQHGSLQLTGPDLHNDTWCPSAHVCMCIIQYIPMHIYIAIKTTLNPCIRCSAMKSLRASANYIYVIDRHMYCKT